MISQNCPKCGSSRVRRGYRPTPFWSKILFRYNLLCDTCNWEFTGFAVPGTVSYKPARKSKKQISSSGLEENEKVSLSERLGQGKSVL
jgi:ribosomal protein L37AE/L43A